MYVPNEYAFACAKESLAASGTFGRLLPAMSVHPYRPDAAYETARWIEQGTVAMKWLPPSQNIDLRDSRCRSIYELLAQARIPLIVHAGGEHTLKVIRPEQEDPSCIRPALEAGVTVVVAHCATPTLWWDTDYFKGFLELARKHPNCYGDTSAMCAFGKAVWLRRLMDCPDILPKLVHGSDWPVPPAAWQFWRPLGLRVLREIGAIPGWLARDVAVKRAMGLPDEVFTNAARIIPLERLARWGLSKQ